MSKSKDEGGGYHLWEERKIRVNPKGVSGSKTL